MNILVSVLLFLAFLPQTPYFGLDNYAEFRWFQIFVFFLSLCRFVYFYYPPSNLQETIFRDNISDLAQENHTEIGYPSVLTRSIDLEHNYFHLMYSFLALATGIIFSIVIHYLDYYDALFAPMNSYLYKDLINPMLWALHWFYFFIFSIYCARFLQPTTLIVTLKPVLIALLLSTSVIFSYMLVNIILSITLDGRIDINIILVEFESIRMLNQFQILSIPLLVFGYQWVRQSAHDASAGFAGQTTHNQDTLASTASRHGSGFYRWQYHLRQRLQPHLSTLTSRLMPWLQPCLRFCLIASYFFIFLTAGRAAMLALLLFAGLLWIYQRQALKPQLCFALIAFLIYQLITRMQGYDYPLLRTDSSMRLEMWGELFANYPWQQLLWGYGGGNYPYLTRLVANAHPHNWMLQWLTDWGFIALMGFVGFCSVVWRCWLWSYRQQHINHHQNQINNAINESAPLADEKNQVAEVSFDLRSYIAMAWLMLLLYGFFDGVMVMPLPQLFFALYSGILLQPLWQNATQLSRAQLSSADFNSAKSHAAKLKCVQRNTETCQTARNTSAQSLALDGDGDANRTSAFSLGLRYLMLLLVFALSLLYLYLAMQSFFTTHALPSPFYGPNFWFIGDPV